MHYFKKEARNFIIQHIDFLRYWILIWFVTPYVLTIIHLNSCWGIGFISALLSAVGNGYTIHTWLFGSPNYKTILSVIFYITRMFFFSFLKNYFYSVIQNIYSEVFLMERNRFACQLKMFQYTITWSVKLRQ